MRWGRYLLVVALVALVFSWGYRQQREKVALSYQLEAQFQRNFQQVIAHLTKLTDQLAMALVQRSARGFNRELSGAREVSEQITTALQSLPLQQLPVIQLQKWMHRTTMQLSAMTESYAVPTARHVTTVEKTYKEVMKLKERFVKMDGAIEMKQLRLVDWQQLSNEPLDQQIVDGFHWMEKTAETNNGQVTDYVVPRDQLEEQLKRRPYCSKAQLKRRLAQLKMAPAKVVYHNPKQSFPFVTAEQTGKSVDIALHRCQVLSYRDTTGTKWKTWRDFMQASGFKVPLIIDERQQDGVIYYEALQEQAGVRYYMKRLTFAVRTKTNSIVQFSSEQYMPHVKDVQSRGAKPLNVLLRERYKGIEIIDPHEALVYVPTGELQRLYTFTTNVAGRTVQLFFSPETGDESFTTKLS